MEEQIFKLHSPYKPTGDQPEAIATLVEGLNKGHMEQKPCSALRVRAKRLPWQT